jgi:hypothetical protein
MQKELVTVLVDLRCTWSGTPPRYRCYVNDELFTERTWTWTDCCLEEMIPIHAEPGQYRIRHQLLDTANAQLKIKNFRVEKGPAVMLDRGWVQIQTVEEQQLAKLQALQQKMPTVL